MSEKQNQNDTGSRNIVDDPEMGKEHERHEDETDKQRFRERHAETTDAGNLARGGKESKEDSDQPRP